MTRLFKMGAALLLAFVLAAAHGAWRKAEAAGLIRDEEVESTIRSYATPLFEAAGLQPRDIRIFIVNDPTLNAFVAGGQNLFLNTGLLTRTRDAETVIGVIAHEAGHIAGGHLARFSERIDTASNTALLTTLLGVIAAVATGKGEAGAAVLMAGQSVALGSLLNYSRTQESAADQAGLAFLERTGQSAEGLAGFLRTIENQEFLSPTNQSPYVRTHPVTRDRVRTIENHLRKSRYTPVKPSAEFEEMHRRMVAKLVAFLDDPVTTLGRYGENDTSVAARYARAIAYYRVPDLPKALALVDGLIANEPANPYFHELKGQILFENGRLAESLAPNAEAARLAPDSALIRLGLARAQMESGNPALIKEAVKNLLYVTSDEPLYAFGWEQLAVAYGRDGQIGLSALAQAEAAMVRNNHKDALFHALRAEKRVEKGSAASLRVNDIIREARDELKRKRRRR